MKYYRFLSILKYADMDNLPLSDIEDDAIKDTFEMVGSYGECEDQVLYKGVYYNFMLHKTIDDNIVILELYEGLNYDSPIYINYFRVDLPVYTYKRKFNLEEFNNIILNYYNDNCLSDEVNFTFNGKLYIYDLAYTTTDLDKDLNVKLYVNNKNCILKTFIDNKCVESIRYNYSDILEMFDNISFEDLVSDFMWDGDSDD